MAKAKSKKAGPVVMEKDHVLQEIRNLSKEEYREYDFIDPNTGINRVYRINRPSGLFLYAGCTTHRVVDSQGMVHLCPVLGRYGCIIRWKPVNPEKPVQF